MMGRWTLGLGWLVGCGGDVPVDPPPPVPADAPCEERPASRCGPCVAVVGRPLAWNPEQGFCVDNTEPLEGFGCRDRGRDCGFAFALATDERGVPWWFPDRCLPDGFELVEEALPDCDGGL